MPYTVIKSSKIVKDQAEVTGEFGLEADAWQFAEDSLFEDPCQENEYTVEIPPSMDLGH